jgi:hypothetical protein
LVTTRLVGVVAQHLAELALAGALELVHLRLQPRDRGEPELEVVAVVWVDELADGGSRAASG